MSVFLALKHMGNTFTLSVCKELFAARVYIWPCPEILGPHWWMMRQTEGAGGDGVIWEGSCHLAAVAAQPEFKLIRRDLAGALLLLLCCSVHQCGRWVSGANIVTPLHSNKG